MSGECSDCGSDMCICDWIKMDNENQKLRRQVEILKSACEKITETTGPNYENWSRHFLLEALEQIKQGE